MSQAVVGALRVDLGLNSAQFRDGLNAAQRSIQNASQQMQRVGTTIAAVGTGMTAAFTAPVIAFGVSLMQGARDAAMASGQVQAALTSMGDGAGRSLEQLTAQAERLSATSLFDDDEILTKVTANLLTFGNVAEENFDRAQQAVIDLSARMDGDLQSATVMIGKALNAPAEGLAALRRAGIQFTDDQETLIKSMVAAGDAAGAQAIMLGELERQFGGAAAAARAADPMAAAMLDLSRAMGTLEEVIAPLMQTFAGMVGRVADFVASLSPAQAQMVVIGGAIVAALGPATIAVGALVASIGAMLPVIAAIGIPLVAVAAAAAAVGVAFYVFRDDIIPIMQAFAASVAENVGPKIAPLWEALKGAVTAIGEVFNAIFGDGSPGGASEALTVFGEIVARVFASAIDLITGATNVVTNILRAFGALLRGDFSAMWGFLGQAVMSAVGGIARAFQTLFPEVVNWVRQTYEGVRTWLVERFNALVGQIGERVAAVGDFFRNLYIAVVGNSWVPDMVEAIADWMGPRLQAALVDPAQAATAEASGAFSGMASDVSSTLDGLFRSISSKDWLGALGGVLNLLSGAGGSVGKYAGVAKSIFDALPGFKDGGSFTVGGSGGIDSQMVAFRATPGEMVDIRKPGQDAGGGVNVTVTPSPYFDVAVERVAGPLATQAGVQAFGGARQAVPADMARRDAYRRG